MSFYHSSNNNKDSCNITNNSGINRINNNNNNENYSKSNNRARPSRAKLQTRNQSHVRNSLIQKALFWRRP